MSEALASQVRRLAREAKLDCISRSRPASADPVRPLIVSVVRNEAPRLQEFLAHYRSLGAGQFVLVENGSTDGTREMLARQPDVDLFAVSESFTTERKHGWITQIVERYGDRWYLLADADEHAVFHGVEDLRALARAAERAGKPRVRGALVDMYGAKPVAAPARLPGQPLLDAYPYFDPAGYVETREVALTTRTGGPRQRMLASVEPSFAPQLTKYPLFRLRPGDTLVSPHYIHPPVEGDDPCWIALLHFKFDNDTPAKVADAIARGQYWRGSYEYRVYNDAFDASPDLAFLSQESRRYRGAADLARLGIIDTVPQTGARQHLRRLRELVFGKKRRG